MHIARVCSLFAATILVAGGCRNHDDAKPVPDETPVVAQASSGAAVAHPGDVRIVSEDGGVDLWLVSDTISSGLSQSTLASAKQGTDTASVKGSGLGASIERMVKSSVQSAIATRVGFPITDIRGATYRDGKIEFDWIGKPRITFNSVNVNKKKLLESFRPEDAQRFVDAVNARARAVGAR
ncbi:MAG: hypothetical protein V4550_03055 [Gemmatimonadota bacterium]